MSKQLILMRHAKSDWGSPELADHDRPLNARGQTAAPQMGRWLQAAGYSPELVLCSSALRTQQTLASMQSLWEHDPKVRHLRDLYLASPDEILRAVRGDAQDEQRVLVLAHNPGLEFLVNQWAKDSMAFPTAAVAVFDLEITAWAQLTLDTRTVCRAIQRVKEL